MKSKLMNAKEAVEQFDFLLTRSICIMGLRCQLAMWESEIKGGDGIG